MNNIIVFSHLRWEFVWQRPQHIIHRLSQYAKVLFIEEPIRTGGDGFRRYSANKKITVLQPESHHLDFGKLSSWLSSYMADWKKDPILWFYSPSFIEMARLLPSSLIVYDCMDQLSAFNEAPKELIAQERLLFKYADIVFTGGKSLYEEKKQYHSTVYCFPSSVDQQHFSKSHKETIPEDLRVIPGPRVGYYGVIDERIDYDLINALASSSPHISFVMIGPFAKVDEKNLPHHPNLHYIGIRSYEKLPLYLKGFDVAMMPFALNDATKFISPTKTLEFMAAGKPIISTPITDVKRDYKREVYIAKTTEEWAGAIRYYLKEPPLRRIYRELLQTAVIERTSWDTTVQKMYKLLVDVWEDKISERVASERSEIVKLIPLYEQKQTIY